MKIVFFGTSSFSVTVLKHLLDSPHQIIAVVTKPDKPQGRSLQLTPPPIKEWLQTVSIPLYQPKVASTDEFVALMQTLSPDLFVVASYGEIMKTPLLDVPRLGSINVHASLLPKWRGAAPIRRTLMAGETETGVTIMKMVLKLDAGDILDVAKTPISFEMNHEELQNVLGTIAKEPLLRVISKLESGTILATPQDALQVTFAAKITPADAIIDWTRPACDIHNQIRALAPEPGAWTMVNIGGQRKKLKIIQSRVVEHAAHTPKQTHILTQKEWIIECGKNCLALMEVQLEGKKKLAIGDFLRGLHQPPTLA